MTVSKRVRFEILRRDKNTCQYCGQMAPDVPLHIDHVIPIALGGSDDPSNLVTACRDCNAGKTSVSPDSPLVKSVSDHAAAYALGLTDRMTRIRSTLQEQLIERDYFRNVWEMWRTASDTTVPMPPDWKSSIDRWHRMGVPRELFVDAIEIAMTKRGLVGEFAEFAYMAGVIWGRINEHEIDYTLTTDTAAVWTDIELQNRVAEARQSGYSDGLSAGVDGASQSEEDWRRSNDFVALHIDADTSHVMERMRYPRVS